MKRFSTIQRTALALTLAATALTASAQDVKVDKYTLPNGMTVILREDHSLPVASVNIWFRVGSKDEADRRSGFAHLFEHLMFMGTKRVPNGQYDKIMEAGGGANNASTAEDRTNYFESGPSNLLPTLLWLEAERLESLGQNIDQKKLDLQRDVVKNERRQNTENTPYGKAYEAINGLMFPSGHPYHTSVIGSMEDLDNATVKDVQDFFATYYVPNNASLVVAGDFDPSAIKPLVAKLFGTLARKNDVPRKSVPDPRFKGVKRVTFVDQVQASKVIMLWHAPAKYQPGDAELNLAGGALSDGVSSRLYKRLITQDKLATSISAGMDSRLLGSLFSIDATAASGVDIAKLEAAIDDELTKFTKSGPTQDELQRQAAKLQFSVVNSLQSIMNTADQLNEYEFYFNEPNSYQKMLDTYKKVTPAAIKKVFAQVVDPNARLIMRVIPALATDQGPNPRDTKPTLEAPKPFQPALPTSFKLSNGIEVKYWQKPELPITSISFRFNRGSDLDTNDKLGAARFTASLMDTGAGTRNASQIEKDLQSLGANVGVGAGNQSTNAALSVLTSNFAKAMPIFADILLRPKFETTELEQLKRLTIAELEQENDNPAAVANKILAREYFGKDNTLARPARGTAETIKALNRDDLIALHKKLFQPTNAVLYAAGNLTPDALKAELEKNLSGWKGDGSKLDKLVPTVPAPQPLRVVLVDRPGAVQTNIRFLLPGVPYSDPDRVAIESLGTVLGGTFTSRLNQNLREDKGYTYGASSRFSFEPTYGTFRASADVRADVTGASLKEFLKELNKAHAGDIDAREASTAGGAISTALISGFESQGGLLSSAERYDDLGVPFATVGAIIEAARKITAADINKVAARSLDLNHGVLVLVGDKATILKQLEGLGLPTPVEVKP